MNTDPSQKAAAPRQGPGPNLAPPYAWRITCVADLAQLPDRELWPCLLELRRAIYEHKRVLGSALQGGAISPFVAFDWYPNNGLPNSDAFAYDAFTLIDDLPLRPNVKRRLRELRVSCLRDLSLIDPTELHTSRSIGRTTVDTLRSWLQAIGLDLGTPHPAKPNHQSATHHFVRNGKRPVDEEPCA